MLWMVIVCGVILFIATGFAMYRLAMGPSLLDRLIASDVIVAITGAGIAVDMVYRDSYENLTLMVVVALVGFLGSVTVARFANNRREKSETTGKTPAVSWAQGKAPGHVTKGEPR